MCVCTCESGEKVSVHTSTGPLLILLTHSSMVRSHVLIPPSRPLLAATACTQQQLSETIPEVKRAVRFSACFTRI